MQFIPYCLQRAFLIHTFIFRVFFLLFYADTISTDAGTTSSNDAGTTITWYILAPTLSVLLLLFVILSCFYYRAYQKKCTVHRDQDTVENATSANQDTIENATSANQGAIESATSANQGTIENATSADTPTEGIYSLISQENIHTSADTPTEGIYSLISQENIHTIYDTGTEFEEYQNNDTSAINEPNNADYSRITFVTNDKKRRDIQHAPDNYSKITFESLKTHQDIQRAPEPLDIPDWGEGDMMAYQNVTTLVKNMDTSKALPDFYESF